MKIQRTLLLLLSAFLLVRCGGSTATDSGPAADAPRPKTPVEVTTVRADTFALERTFRGRTFYLTGAGAWAGAGARCGRVTA